MSMFPLKNLARKGLKGYQAITWANFDLSSQVFYGIHLTAISQEMLMNLICKVFSNYTLITLS